MQKRLIAALTCAALLGLAGSAQTHFQVLYTPELNHAEPGTVPFRLVFTHPASNGPVMDMDTPQEFFVVHQGQRTDLGERLTPITWTDPSKTGKAFAADVPLRRNGDYVFVVVPQPYHEEGDGYIQQFTKLIVNRGGLPSDWNEPVGLPAEILPLVKPYALYTGMLFSGQVLSDGEPLPGAEIEVEYMNHEVLLEENRFREDAIMEPPSPAFETFVTHADANGIFHFALPRAGFWGFSAVEAGPVTEHNGEELSQEAVIWVQVHDLP